ncbi:MAG: efflux RND transporter periplasmic adaptor subunit [bacterium]|nr:efflux RND transporter periplasmic adaptor subunit [Gammaproteobacteria bacterium]
MTTKAKSLTALAVLLILGGVLGFDQFKQRIIAKKLAEYKPPSVAVTTQIAQSEDWTKRLTAVGEITARSAVNVTTQISGQVLSIHFDSGDVVEAGQLLVQLDDQLLRDQLIKDEAEAKLSQLDVDRYTKLVAEKSASQVNLDRATANRARDRAASNSTSTKIDYMAIKTPFAGQVGIRQVNVGDFLSPGSSIVNLQNRRELYVDFSLPENYLPLLKQGLQVDISTDAFPGKTFSAQVTGIAPQVDPNSRNIDVRAQFPEATPDLVPGLFVTVEVVTLDSQTLITLPAVAVSYSMYGDTVFVVDEKSADGYAIERRNVTVAMQRQSQVALSDGVVEGDQVITSNQQQLDKSSIVIINNGDVSLDSAKTSGE